MCLYLSSPFCPLTVSSRIPSAKYKGVALVGLIFPSHSGGGLQPALKSSRKIRHCIDYSCLLFKDEPNCNFLANRASRLVEWRISHGYLHWCDEDK